MVHMKGRNLLSLKDLSREEIMFIIESSMDMKLRFKMGITDKPLEGKTLAMIFQKPSTRTRVSFEVAMYQLGGHALYLGWNDLQLGRGETIADTARVLSRYVDAIMARVFSHEDLVEMAKYSRVPVINGLSDEYHPCQILADLQTILEKKGRLKGLKLAYLGDGNNVCNSLMIGCTKVGMDVYVASPKDYRPKDDVVKMAEDFAEESGCELVLTEDPFKAAEEADVLYTDVWVSMGMEKEREERMRVFPPYQINEKIVSVAKDDVIVMHCLPAHRGLEITDDVIDGRNSAVWDEAENRLHVQKAILANLIK
ncbi:MAG: ornithine carbamoyltransferase [Candidatus Asgardarchaeia archaeon]